MVDLAPYRAGSFESPTIVQRKLEAEFGKNTPKKNCIIATFQRFCETGTVENRERLGRLAKTTEKKIDSPSRYRKSTTNKCPDCCNGLPYFLNNGTSNYDCIEILQSPICSKTW